MTIEIRQAGVGDAHGIALVHVQAWTETYAHLVAAETLARQRVDQRELRWAEMLAEPASNIWVAIDGGDVVGFASSNLPRDENPPRDLELGAIYVLASHYGAGAGQALLDAAISDRPAVLWVADDNPRARSFYTRNGFTPDGTSDTHSLAGTPVRAIRMVR